jgi:acetyl esterase/lipase
MSRAILDLAPPPAGLIVPYGPDPLQVVDQRLPPGPGPHPLVVTIHGGFWRNRYDRLYMGHLAAALTAQGYASWNIEYRRLGDAGGGWPGTLQDAAAALDHLRAVAQEYALDPARVITLGHSAGGHLAFWLAARRRLPATSPLYHPDPLPPAGAIALGGVVDLRAAWEMALSDQVVESFLGAPPDAIPERYAAASPYELLPLGVPQILIHGTADESVPYAIAERYAATARALGDDARLITLDGVDHFDPVDPRSAVWPTVLDAVRLLLG